MIGSPVSLKLLWSIIYLIDVLLGPFDNLLFSFERPKVTGPEVTSQKSEVRRKHLYSGFCVLDSDDRGL